MTTRPRRYKWQLSLQIKRKKGIYGKIQRNTMQILCSIWRMHKRSRGLPDRILSTLQKIRASCQNTTYQQKKQYLEKVRKKEMSIWIYQSASHKVTSALINRMFHVQLKADAKQWINWAYETGLHPWVIDYITQRPDHLFSEPPKALTRTSWKQEKPK